ncbi:MAG: c-type cytochrome, partial [Chthoniobacterales bacterium]
DNHLVSIVLHGLQGPVQVGSGAFNGAMPGWKFLSDAEIAAVLNCVRGEWGNSAPPIAESFVKSVREQNARRTAAWSQGELQSLKRALAPAPPRPVPKARQ